MYFKCIITKKLKVNSTELQKTSRWIEKSKFVRVK